MTLLTINSTFSPEVAPQDVQRIIDATKVVDVRLDEVHAGPVGSIGPEMSVHVQVEEPQLGHLDEQNRVLVRFSHSVECSPSNGEGSPTKIQLAHVVTFDVIEELETTWPAVAAWIETNAYFIAYPYVRQSVSTLTTNLGLPALVLDYLGRDDRPFSSWEESEAGHDPAD
ncbi:hypothetical protein [Microbacterium sp. P5_E9]